MLAHSVALHFTYYNFCVQARTRVWLFPHTLPTAPLPPVKSSLVQKSDRPSAGLGLTWRATCVDTAQGRRLSGSVKDLPNG